MIRCLVVLRNGILVIFRSPLSFEKDLFNQVLVVSGTVTSNTHLYMELMVSICRY